MKRAKLLLWVAKVPLSLLVSASALFGFVLQKAAFSGELFITTFGVFLLSTGAASLNNIQDTEYDRHFTRTCNRPLPRGILSKQTVFVQVLILLTAGTALLLWVSGTILPALVGLATVVFYNGLYTPLKTKSVWAILPGAICGMLPPYIGWLSAGGVLYDPVIALWMVILGIWQIPHSWMTLLKQRQEFFKHSRYYSVVTRYSVSQLRKVTLVWVVAFASLSLMWPLVGMADRYAVTRYLLLVNAVLLCASFLKVLIRNTDPSLGRLFLHLNMSLAAVMLLVGFDSIA
ncbi:MAG: UbiA family prenyltransferase [Proteobacteria bacterium]|nr:UbiA family prenyltransferase [Pseudomonadota bacterium]